MQKKTMWITAAAVGAVLVLGGAGAAFASSDLFDDDDDRATSTSTGTGSDDRSRSDDGRDDSDGRSDDGGDSGRDDNGGDRDDSSDDSSDDNSVPATADERSAAEAAALDEIGQGTVREFDTGDSDDDYAYKVELVMDDGSEVEVELASDLSVLRIDRN
ncbi:hypothetical protein ASF06_02375 [Agreia sp. Leaf244]|uniref:hypothetical protein n=1 Tax=Agreia sp. Leaf244 TaxID=1736305 RepID=UPI0006FF34F2|nr:hypothetical protein [Agreia sp. Leaf244]KQO11512.1 hypothetical protein ASF06_02375 [Agreia sp. Leaf244]